MPATRPPGTLIRSADAPAAAFPGAIKQFVAAVDNRKRNDAGVIGVGGRLYPFESRAFGKDRWYGGKGVHAPN